MAWGCRHRFIGLHSAVSAAGGRSAAGGLRAGHEKGRMLLNVGLCLRRQDSALAPAPHLLAILVVEIAPVDKAVDDGGIVESLEQLVWCVSAPLEEEPRQALGLFGLILTLLPLI
ncbi:hypothetical protein ABL78_8221 [Leptomonas seymouri]|uniref:Uncharacterized protein n=1 Tax=Leptomonas seymouri TaxID=5684 RepID=A0A0N1HYG6_LEPSE|nr:hypothetical protein ABL78_8221 [Leptomonas seymouri]|eukprot:KPI82763.1 hypothetical protein ABL78_8221 [Leptomonas seymouri]